MRQHCANADAVAHWLTKHPKIVKVIFPGLMSGERKRRADAYLRGGYVRLSLGIEHIDDILADLEQALAAA